MATPRFDITNTDSKGKPIKPTPKPLVQEDTDAVKAAKEKEKEKERAKKAAEASAKKAVETSISNSYGRSNALREAITATERRARDHGT